MAFKILIDCNTPYKDENTKYEYNNKQDTHRSQITSFIRNTGSVVQN